MNKSEEWLIEVDENDVQIGKIERRVAHGKGKLRLHREVMTLLFVDKKHSKFILQHRSIFKEQLPGLWTLSATGHVDYADINHKDMFGYLSAAIRETKEEIGVKTKNYQLVGKIIQKNEKNYAMMGIVIGEYEGEIKLDLEEVSEVQIFDKVTVAQVSDKLTPGALACLKYLNLLN